MFSLARTFDRSVGGQGKVRGLQLDQPTIEKMSFNHQNIAKGLRSLAERDLEHLAPTFVKPKLALDESFDTNTPFRLGGFGTVLPVSHGEGTGWHVDQGDDSVSVLLDP